MKFTDVLNMDAATLKASKKEATEVVKASDRAEIDTRFLSILYDAKVRDEKLAEQGQTIKDYQERCDEQKARIAELEKALTKSNTSIESLNKEVETYQAKTEQNLGKLKDELKNQSDRAAKSSAKAKARRKVLVDIVNLVTPLLAEEDNG